MCGRYKLSAKPAAIAELLGLPAVPELFLRFNISPTQTVAAAVAVTTLTWGSFTGTFRGSGAVFTLQQTGSAVTGTARIGSSDNPVSGTAKGNTLTFGFGTSPGSSFGATLSS